MAQRASIVPDWPARGGPPTRTAHLLAVGAITAVLGTLGGLAVARAVDTRQVDDLWRRLEATPVRDELFTDKLVAHLAAPARRYFQHAIQPGTQLATRVYLHQTGTLRLSADGWVPFDSEQLLVPGRGFVWKVHTRGGLFPLAGTDHYVNGRGRTHIALLGLLPVINAAGSDIARSALGRLAGETMWLPTGWLPGGGTQVEPIDADHFAVITAIQGEVTRLTLAVDAVGRLTEITFPRYGNQTEDKHYQLIPFGSRFSAERTFNGYTIPTEIRAGWWYGTERFRDTFHIAVESAQFA
jgi:hypothetical protein